MLDTINGTVLCLQTGIYHGCPLRGSTDQLILTYADTHNQTMDGAWALLGRIGGRIAAPKWIETPQENQVYQLTWSLGYSETEPQPKNIIELGYASQHVCSTCVS